MKKNKNLLYANICESFVNHYALNNPDNLKDPNTGKNPLLDKNGNVNTDATLYMLGFERDERSGRVLYELLSKSWERKHLKDDTLTELNKVYVRHPKYPFLVKQEKVFNGKIRENASKRKMYLGVSGFEGNKHSTVPLVIAPMNIEDCEGAGWENILTVGEDIKNGDYNKRTQNNEMRVMSPEVKEEE